MQGRKAFLPFFYWRRNVNLSHPRLPLPPMRASWMVLVALFCDGCFPAEFITTPAVRGVVVDRQTSAPVAGAEVIISRARFDPWIMVDPATHQPLIVNDPRLLSPKAPALSEVLKRARPPAVQTADDGSFFIAKHSQ